MPTLKGVLRSAAAAQRRAERESIRRQRELERQRNAYAKMQELERAQYEVELFNNRIEVLTSVHKDCGPTVSWENIHRYQLGPGEPKRENYAIRENNSRLALESYQPGVKDKLLRRTKSKQLELEEAVEQARRKDEEEYQEAIQVYEEELAEWEESKAIAQRIVEGDIEAYIEAIKHLNPFSEISEIGSSVSFSVVNAKMIEVVMAVNSEKVIPNETKSLLKSGKLSTKNMTRTKFYELYQDYVCSCVLRVARELFALLPIEMVLITAKGNLLNTSTGFMEEMPILSVAIPQETSKNLNYDAIDPSDSMVNFVHNMKFQKTNGFQPVDALKSEQFQKNFDE